MMRQLYFSHITSEWKWKTEKKSLETLDDATQTGDRDAYGYTFHSPTKSQA